VVFGAENGIYVVSGSNLTKLSSKLEGRVILQDISGIENRISGLYIGNSAQRIDNIMQDYFTQKSFCVHDKIENELLFIEPTKDFSIVLMLNDMSWVIRKDTFYKIAGVNEVNFDDFVEVNNEYILIKTKIKRLFTIFGGNCYRLAETTHSKVATNNSNTDTNINNNAVLFASGTIMTNQYTKIEHIIARFNQITDTEFDSHILLIGSRDGIEWKVLNHSFAKFPKGMSGQQMRRCFTSARYFQFVYIRIERGKQNTQNRKDSYFERFTFDISNNDAENKLR